MSASNSNPTGVPATTVGSAAAAASTAPVTAVRATLYYTRKNGIDNQTTIVVGAAKASLSAAAADDKPDLAFAEVAKHNDKAVLKQALHDSKPNVALAFLRSTAVVTLPTSDVLDIYERFASNADFMAEIDKEGKLPVKDQKLSLQNLIAVSDEDNEILMTTIRDSKSLSKIFEKLHPGAKFFDTRYVLGR